MFVVVMKWAHQLLEGIYVVLAASVLSGYCAARPSVHTHTQMNSSLTIERVHPRGCDVCPCNCDVNVWPLPATQPFATAHIDNCYPRTACAISPQNDSSAIQACTACMYNHLIKQNLPLHSPNDHTQHTQEPLPTNKNTPKHMPTSHNEQSAHTHTPSSLPPPPLQTPPTWRVV